MLARLQFESADLGQLVDLFLHDSVLLVAAECLQVDRGVASSDVLFEHVG